MARLAERFHVGKRLGSGGAGHVYPAMDRSSGEVLAIKMIRNVDHDDPNFVQRFEREGRIHQGLRGRYILHVFEHGAWDEGLAIVMELADGPSLSAAIEAVKAQGKRPFSVLFPLLDQAMSGIAEVHAVDVIHRDLKPENILTVIERGHLVAKVADFGLARDVDNSLTRTNTAMGTPCYASPEQFRDASRVDHRTDIYSFGVMLYQLLASERPYDGESFLTVGNACVNGEWELPRTRDPSLPQAADDLIQTAMALDPADRFASVLALQAAARSLAAEMGVDLAGRVPGDIAPGPPVSFGEDTGPPPEPEVEDRRTSRVSTTSKVAVAAGGGLILAGLGLLALLGVGVGGAWYAGLFTDDDVEIDEGVQVDQLQEDPEEPSEDPKDDPEKDHDKKDDDKKDSKPGPGVGSLTPPGPPDPVKPPKAREEEEKDPAPLPEPVDTLAHLSSTASPSKVKAGASTTIQITATGTDDTPYTGAKLTATADGGTVGSVRESGGGSYTATATAGSGTSMSVTIKGGGASTTSWVTIEQVQVQESWVDVRFSCIGCSSDMDITDSKGSFWTAYRGGETLSVRQGALSIVYGGVRHDVSVSGSTTKVKCTQAGCTVY